MLQKTKNGRIKNEEIWNILEFEKLQNKQESNRNKWFGHVMRMGDDRLSKMMFTTKINGRRALGISRNKPLHF